MSRRMGHKSHRPPPSKRSDPNIPIKGNAKTTTIGTIVEQDRSEMAASFLQFCATCEKQIYTPSNSILYCSEACRRKDSSKPLSLSLSAGAMTPSISPPSSASSSPRPLLPTRIPTGASHSSISSTSSSLARIPTDLHHAKSDLDPTEWKPKLQRRGLSSTTNSEAFRYLCRFHDSTITTTNNNNTSSEDDTAIERVQRPTMMDPSFHRSTTSLNTLTTVPSPAETPTTTAPSSLGTSLEYTTVTYDFNTRPLPPRHDPSYSSSAGAAKSIELVMPHVAPPAAPVIAGSAADHIQFHGGVWEKQTVRSLPRGGGPEEVKHGLGALFGDGEK